MALVVGPLVEDLFFGGFPKYHAYYREIYSVEAYYFSALLSQEVIVNSQRPQKNMNRKVNI